MPTQAPPGYRTPQGSDIPCGSSNNPLLSQEFYRATSNLGTAIIEPQQVPPQCLVGNHHPDPEIESAIANMYRHEQASGMPSIDSNNNPQWGHGLSCSLFTCYTWNSRRLSSPWGIQKTEDWKPKAQPLLIGYVIFTIRSCNLSLLLGFLYLFAVCVLFRKNHVNVFALCSRPYRYSWFISGLAALVSCTLSFQTTVHYNVRLKHSVLGEHCIVILLYYCTMFSSLDF